VEGQIGSGSIVMAEIENDLPAGSGGKLHRCRCMCDGKVLWEQLLSARILTIAGSRYDNNIFCICLFVCLLPNSVFVLDKFLFL
jgi:hypothetical protein